MFVRRTSQNKRLLWGAAYLTSLCVLTFSVDLFLVCYSAQCECLGRCTVEKYQCPWIPHYGTFHHIIPVCSGVLLHIEDIFVVMFCVPYKWKSCLFSALMLYIEFSGLGFVSLCPFHCARFIFVLCVVCMLMLRFVTRWGGPGGIEAYP